MYNEYILCFVIKIRYKNTRSQYAKNINKIIVKCIVNYFNNSMQQMKIVIDPTTNRNIHLYIGNEHTLKQNINLT